MLLRSLVPALDTVDLDEAEHLAHRISHLKQVSAFKVGFGLALSHSLPAVAARLRKITDKPLIYDHQKGGTDIPDTAPLFAAAMERAGIAKAILFPFTGPETLAAWIAALQQKGVEPVVGGLMTHPGFTTEEGGFLDSGAPEKIYSLARSLGVTSFVVPLTRPELVRSLHARRFFPPGAEIYSPGLGAQGGKPADFTFLPRLHLIAGRSLLRAADPVEYMRSLEPWLEEAP